MAEPAFLNPLVLPVELRAAERVADVDLYLPDDVSGPVPVVVLVHGGPTPPQVRPTVRHWPMYQGYASLLAGRGVAAAMAELGLSGPDKFPAAADNLAAAIETVRKDPRIDAERVVLWHFSGGAMLMSDYLRDRPGWLRAIAASYPLVGAVPGLADDDPRFRPAEVVGSAGDIPLVLTLVGREMPPIAATVEAFLPAVRASTVRLTTIEVPNGQHSFDILDDTDESRAAIVRALDTVVSLA